MSFKNKVAIIGRPNVGKSTLFNILTGTRNAVVKNQPGVTRDIQYGQCEWEGKVFDVADTGGLTESQDLFSRLIKEQVFNELSKMSALILVMDGKFGVCPEDRDVFLAAKQTGLPFIIVVNKLDRRDHVTEKVAEFYEFEGEILPAAFEQRDGIPELLDWIAKTIEVVPQEKAEDRLTIAIVGKPNAGKSSLVNQLLGDDKMLVSEIAGTTVDAVDSPFEYGGEKYTLIDTAGLRRRAKRKDGVEMISSFKSRDAIYRADMILLVIDAVLGPSEQDARIIEQILETHKPVILVANKVDIGEETIPRFRETFRNQVKRDFHFFEDVPISFVSAKTGRGIDKLFENIKELWRRMNIDISTSELNDFFFETIRKAPSPVAGPSDVKFYYLTQTQQKPPSFIAFANFPEGVTTAYRRFLIRNIKERWGLDGVPIRIFVMKSRNQSEKDERPRA